MERELANNMYGPSAYFLARFLSNLFIIILYPTIMTTCIFWGIGIITTFENFCWILIYGVVGTMSFMGQGYFCGIICKNDESATGWNSLLIMLWITTSGVMSNLGAMNPIISAIALISPQRFTCEGIYRCLTKQIGG